MADYSLSLDNILVQQQALKEDDRALLGKVVDHHIAARGGDEAYRTKSVLEAEVTGGLEHSGIVDFWSG